MWTRAGALPLDGGGDGAHSGFMAENDTPAPGPAQLDARGLLCPLPVLKAAKRLRALKPGEALRLLADDPAAVVDVPHYCAESGNVLESTAEEGGAQVYVIRRT